MKQSHGLDCQTRHGNRINFGSRSSQAFELKQFFAVPSIQLPIRLPHVLISSGPEVLKLCARAIIRVETPSLSSAPPTWHCYLNSTVKSFQLVLERTLIIEKKGCQPANSIALISAEETSSGPKSENCRSNHASSDQSLIRSRKIVLSFRTSI